MRQGQKTTLRSCNLWYLRRNYIKPISDEPPGKGYVSSALSVCIYLFKSLEFCPSDEREVLSYFALKRLRCIHLSGDGGCKTLDPSNPPHVKAQSKNTFLDICVIQEQT